MHGNKSVMVPRSCIFTDLQHQIWGSYRSRHLGPCSVFSPAFIRSTEISAQRTVSQQASGQFPDPSLVACPGSIWHTGTRVAKWDVPTTWQDLQSQRTKGQQGYLKHLRPLGKKKVQVIYEKSPLLMLNNLNRPDRRAQV